MNNNELNRLMGANLQKLRRKAKLTQEQLAERLSVNTRLIQRWEAGSKGIGKDVLTNLCSVFKVKPYVFYTDDKDPVITSPRELKVIYRTRKAEKLGVADVIDHFGEFMVCRAEQSGSKPPKKINNRKIRNKDGCKCK